MEIIFRLFPVIHPLTGLIEKIWYFEAPGKLPDDQLNLIVPNGRPLLLLACRNRLLAKMGKGSYAAAENRLSLVGVSDAAAIIGSGKDGPTASIGLEFSPMGLYRFFEIPAKELANDLNGLPDISGKEAAELERRVEDIVEPADKVMAIQRYFLSVLHKKQPDPLFEYCVQQIEKTKGAISIRQLEKATGYSSRWLHSKFKQQLGLSPKNFSSVIRFQRYYQLITRPAASHATRLRHNPYYDQSHFIKDFRRFTGMTPTRLVELENSFGKLFF